MKYEGMSTVQGEVRKASGDAVYIRRKRFSGSDSSSAGFFGKLFRQFVATMAALILLFACNLIPFTRNILDDVKDAVKTDYTDDILTVFNEN